MDDKEVRALALFFFFACLDEFRAKEAASKAADEFERLLRRDPLTDRSVALVLACSRVWNKNRARIHRGRPQYSSDSGWLLPEKSDLGNWKEFQKSAPEDELLSVIWVHILNYPEDKVSIALGLTAGTLRYRVGRGLRKLGSFVMAKSKPLKMVKPNE